VKVKSVDDKAAKAVKGVRQIVRLEDAVAVVADHMGAAKKGLAALVIEWDDGPHAKLTTEDIASELEKATPNSGPVPSVNVIRKSLCTTPRFKFPVLAYKFPVPSQKFPVPLSREFRSKSTESLDELQPLSRELAQISKIPCSVE
jgi:isoquinoline 1-oxidoreductase beta subunit